MTSILEIELKYRLPDAATANRLAAASTVGRFQVDAWRVRQLVDVYYDTPDRAFARAGFAFRFRQGETNGRVDLKALAKAEDEVHRRLEISARTEQPAAPDQWPFGPARDLALPLVSQAPVSPLFRIEQTRRLAALLLDGAPIADFSIDEVHWRAGEAVQQGWELEVELHMGQDEALLAELAHVLTHDWGLAAEPESKYERGLRLCRRD